MPHVSLRSSHLRRQGQLGQSVSQTALPCHPVLKSGGVEALDGFASSLVSKEKGGASLSSYLRPERPTVSGYLVFVWAF